MLVCVQSRCGFTLIHMHISVFYWRKILFDENGNKLVSERERKGKEEFGRELFLIRIYEYDCPLVMTMVWMRCKSTTASPPSLQSKLWLLSLYALYVTHLLKFPLATHFSPHKKTWVKVLHISLWVIIIFITSTYTNRKHLLYQLPE